ncbi:MAG: GGDEF domain-containing phosphodiesterase [Treponemataceae bacterium]|nr:GGDEF domain-containing phosphodiesterase [Treponemataceae bacterium]
MTDILLCVVVGVLLTSLIIFAVLFQRWKSDLKNEKKALEYDALTGLYSELGFTNHAKEILKKHPDEDYFILDMDIDNFSFFRSAYGYERSDQLLRHIGALLFDMCEQNEIVAHLRHDHFVMLVRGIADEQKNEIEERFKTFMSTMVDKVVLAHFGAYQINDRSENIEDMCIKASFARRAIKGKRSEIMKLYDNPLLEQHDMEAQLSARFETALRNNEFEVFFQPKYDTVTEKIAGAEALVRWRQEDGSMLSPAEFIPVYEHNGLITFLDFFVYEKVCQIIHDMIVCNVPVVPISVNFSRVNLYDASFSRRILDIARKYGVPQSLIEIELTESVMFEDENLLIDITRQLHQEGFRVSIDDFGKGYSSLSLIQKNSFDVVKIDQAFLDHSEDRNGTSAAILKSIFSLAKDLNLETVAEGVEDKAQLPFLRDSGCSLIQGFCFSKPVEHSTFKKMLVEN